MRVTALRFRMISFPAPFGRCVFCRLRLRESGYAKYRLNCLAKPQAAALCFSRT